MLVPLLAGLASTALLLAVAAKFSPEWSELKRIRKKKDLVDNDGAFLFLGVFGAAIGTPAALGFVDGNALLVLGGFLATIAGSAPLSSPWLRGPRFGSTAGPRPDEGTEAKEPHRTGGPKNRDRPAPGNQGPWIWFVIFSWAVLSAGLSLETFDLRRALAAQAVFGPAVFAKGGSLSLFLSLGFAAGLVSAIFCCANARPASEDEAQFPANAFLNSGRAAVAGSALTASFFGPSLGALGWGPWTPDLLRGAAGSFILTCMVVAVISWSRRIGVLPVRRAAQIITAAFALAAMSAAASLR